MILNFLGMNPFPQIKFALPTILQKVGSQFQRSQWRLKSLIKQFISGPRFLRSKNRFRNTRTSSNLFLRIAASPLKPIVSRNWNITSKTSKLLSSNAVHRLICRMYRAARLDSSDVKSSITVRMLTLPLQFTSSMAH